MRSIEYIYIYVCIYEFIRDIKSSRTTVVDSPLLQEVHRRQDNSRNACFTKTDLERSIKKRASAGIILIVLCITNGTQHCLR